MGTIAVHEFITLDGVFEDPKWTFEYGFDPRMGETLAAITGASRAILLGRTTFEMFAPAWSTRTVADDPGAPFFNDTPKYVVGSQEPAVRWANSTRLGPYDPGTIGKLRDETEGTIYISGSGTLVRALLRDGLVDDLHLFVYPVALGSGKRFWAEGVDPTKLVLKEQQAYDNGVLHLGYGPARP
ncbi:dihydrofolate reductase [Kutzneria viridogrisea]|uniref:Bifunctional deaminase-reductase domain protein n=2 Tax=Kutzneria TaxID=43356 RepID=W5W6Z3_9PSEU|nr:dihydrofolate reductase family protein [Kutzneria albida]AHH96301.1 bifunctional deaminase-reductase domain protein [Kutzneria albida DSM 43870]MBA8928484.1 dihydrofolate reductase [Kutzneria viridogrisea]